MRCVSGIQGLSGASVQVAKESAGGTSRTVTITGAPACVATAQSLVAQAIAQTQQPKSGPRPGAAAGSASVPEGPRVELRLPCPSDRIGWVIGPGGVTVKAIRTLSGAQLDMLEEVTETGGRRGVVVLSGTAEAVETAKTAVGGLLGDAAGSKAYAAQLAEAAEARRKWDEEQRRAQQAPPASAEGAAAGASADAAEAAKAAAAAAAAEWKEVTAKHPDGTTLRYWRHVATGMCRW